MSKLPPDWKEVAQSYQPETEPCAGCFVEGFEQGALWMGGRLKAMLVNLPDRADCECETCQAIFFLC